MPRGWSDSLFDVDAQGNIVYDFRGHVHAQGLDLDAGTLAAAPPDNQVRWLRTTDGGVVSWLLAYEDAATNELRIGVNRPGDAQEALLQLSAGQVADSAQVKVTVINSLGDIEKRLLTTDGSSDYAFSDLSNAHAGVFSLHWNASVLSDVLTVPHGLGVVPRAILLTPTYIGTGRPPDVAVLNTGAATFDVIGRDWAGAVTQDVPTYWLAIG